MSSTANGSLKTRLATANGTLCSSRFFAAFEGSHSNLGMPYIIRAARTGQNRPRLGPFPLRALQDLFAPGGGNAGLAAAIFTSLLPERQTGFDPACCAACWAVGQRWGFRCHRGAVGEKCAPAATFAAATPAASPA